MFRNYFALIPALLLFAGCATFAASGPDTITADLVMNGEHGTIIIQHNEDGTLNLDALLDNGQRYVREHYRPSACYFRAFVTDEVAANSNDVQVGMLRGVAADSREAARALAGYHSALYYARLRQDCPLPESLPFGAADACDLDSCTAGAEAQCEAWGGSVTEIDWVTGDHCRFKCSNGKAGAGGCVKAESGSNGGLQSEQNGGNGGAGDEGSSNGGQ